MGGFLNLLGGLGGVGHLGSGSFGNLLGGAFGGGQKPDGAGPGASPDQHPHGFAQWAGALSPLAGMIMGQPSGLGGLLGAISPLYHMLHHDPAAGAPATPGALPGAPGAPVGNPLAAPLQAMTTPGMQGGGYVPDAGMPPAAQRMPGLSDQINNVISSLPQQHRDLTPIPTPEGMTGGGGGMSGLHKGLKTAAGVASMVPGPVGIAGTIASMFLAEGGSPGDSRHQHAMNGMLDELYSAMQGQHPNTEGAAMNYADLLLPGSMDGYQGGGGDQGGPGAEGAPPEEGGGAPHEGMVKGDGGGMDDTVPAQSEDQNIQLSNDEFVIPADVVSMLGDGSSEAGAQKLYEFISSVRQMKQGHDQQAQPTPPQVFDDLLGPEGGQGEGAGEGASANSQSPAPEAPPEQAPSEEPVPEEEAA